jgi:hypothetical protein
MSTTPSRDRSRSAIHPISGNEAVPIAAGPRRTVAQALSYASCGWQVFPCQPGTKEPATQHGFHDASTDREQIESWWRRIPFANLAIATGAPGPDVLDIDQRGPAGNGYAALMRLKHAELLDNSGTLIRTPHGGLHVYFIGSDQASGRLSRHHLDFKAVGGYVLAPPSQVDGRPYYSVRQAASSGGLIGLAATHVLDPQPSRLARQELATDGDVGRLVAWVERLEEGNRNAGLFWAACRAVESGQSRVLDEIAAAAARTGLSEREISRTIDSARRGSQQRADRQAGREATR